MKVKRLTAFIGRNAFSSISAQVQMPSNAFQGIEGDVSITLQWTNVNDIMLDLYFEYS